jgi:hypothetical protein
MLDLRVFEDGYAVSGSTLAKSEKNDCVVRACANAFEIEYEQAHTFVKERFGRADKAATKNTHNTLNDLCDEVTVFKATEGNQLNLFNDVSSKAYEIQHVGVEPKKGGTLINKKYKHKKVAYTIKTFMQNYTKGIYLLLVNGHALAVKNGVVVDNPNYRFDGYRRTVASAFEVKKYNFNCI